MAITNNNVPGLDSPAWEQLPNAPANSAAGSCVCDDNERFKYYLISATQFWRLDTWAGTWQQLANLPGGTVAAGTCIRYLRQLGSQLNGVVYGSVLAFVCSGSAVTFYRYDTGANTWSTSLSVTGIPSAFGTDGRLVCPEPMLNAYQGGYHSAVALNTITTTASAAAGATTLAVSALPLALPSGAVLNFGSATAPLWAVLTASAAAAATSLTVAALIAPIGSAATAYFYGDMFLVGNNATVVYRYNFAAALWYTTSANSGNPTLAAVPNTVGAGTVACWLPGAYDATLNPNALNTLQVLRGGGNSTIYEYNLATNTWSTLTYAPATEGFTTGTASAIQQDASGKNAKLILHKDTTGRFYRFDRAKLRLDPLCTQTLFASGTALVGDRATMLRVQGIDMLYFIPSTSSYVLRTALLF